jgi:hypothetical protein
VILFLYCWILKKKFNTVYTCKLHCHAVHLRIYSTIFQVVVPKTYPKYTSRKVLTTGWVDGEKLSQSTEDDVGSLVNVGVICYLKQVCFSSSFLYITHVIQNCMIAHVLSNGKKCYLFNEFFGHVMYCSCLILDSSMRTHIPEI